MLAGFVSRGDLTVSETTGISLRAQRAVELVDQQPSEEGEECAPTVAQFKMTAQGQLLTSVCPNPETEPGPYCVDNRTPYVTVHGVAYYLLGSSDGYNTEDYVGVAADECTTLGSKQ